MNLKETFFPKIFIFAAVLCFLCGTATAQTVTIAKTFTESSSWEIPAGVTSVTIECVGGGGAGGYVHGEELLFRNSGGGGGGAYARKVQDVSPGQTLYITVGAGGYAWASDENQVNGGSSEVSINSVIVVKAAGGKTVKGTNNLNGAAGGSVSECMGDAYSGGNGANAYTVGTVNFPGGGGGAAGSTGPGNSANNSNGGAARANYGGAGGNASTIIGSGKDGEEYGGGGAGSRCTGIGGEYGANGANGIVVITYDAPISMIVDNMADSICSGNSFSIVPTGTIPDGTTYTWSAPSVSGISGTASGSGASNISGTLTNNTYDNIDVVYNVTAKKGSVEYNFTVTITVRSLINAGVISENIISCNAGDTLKTITSITDAQGTGRYYWERSTDKTTWYAIANASDKDYTPSYAGFEGKTYYRRVFYSHCSMAISNIDSVNYPGNVVPGGIYTEDAKNNYCYGTNIDDTLKANSIVQNGSFTIQWQEWNGTNWTDIAGANDTLYKIVITNFTASKKFRFIFQLPGCSKVPSINTWELNVVAPPVINKLTHSDTCPGLNEYYVTADITSGDGAISLYQWDSKPASPYTIDTLYKVTSDACNANYAYSLVVIDEYGCASEKATGSFTTPSKPSITIASVPADYNKSACKYMVPNLKDTITTAFLSDCEFFIPASYTQDSVVGAQIAPGATVPVKAIYKTECDLSKNDTLVINVVAPSTVLTITTADIDFDDSNDTIRLYYGICDTLYYVNKPIYSAIGSFDVNDLTLSNDKSSENEGPILGRISDGEYTIVWRLTSPCGSYVEYPKKYVVMYPPCGGSMTVTDVDGNEYETVRVGCECWTKTNLKTTTVSDTSYAYQNDDSNVAKFGRLYSWYSAVGLPKNSTSNPTTTTDPISNVTYIQGVCPSGWALPTTASYENLYLASGEDVNKLKSSTGSDWLTGMSGTDAYGFGAVGGGYYMSYSPYYYDLLGEAYFWICEGDPIAMKGECSSITFTCPILLIRTFDAGMGFSVRCVKREN